MPADRLPQSADPRVLAQPATAHPEVRIRPRLRGVLHQYAFFVSLASGTVLVLLAATTKASVAVAIYAASVSALFGVSALYHRITWTTVARRRMRRLDHAMIFLLIAGTYTPVGLLVLQGTLATGGLLYSARAAVYALRRPHPAPAVYDYHEVFHLLIIAAVAAPFLAISLYALPTR